MQKKILLLLIIPIFLLLINPAFSLNIASCTNMNSAGTTYDLTTDLSVGGVDCMVAGANNIILDCHNHLIDGNDAGGVVAVKCVSRNDIIIRNCRVNDYYVPYYFENCDNVTLTNINSTSSPNNYGIWYQQGRGIYINDYLSDSTGYVEIFFAGIGYLNNSKTNSISCENTFNITNSEFNGAISIYEPTNNWVYNNKVSSNVCLWKQGGSCVNTFFYNNLFNCTQIHSEPYDSCDMAFNTTRHSGTRIYGSGDIGGNYWANPSGTGISQTCIDANDDCFCDSSYNVFTGHSIGVDYLPYSCIEPSGCSVSDLCTESAFCFITSIPQIVMDFVICLSPLYWFVFVIAIVGIIVLVFKNVIR